MINRRFTKPRRYLRPFGPLVTGAPPTVRTISFNVPYGGRIVGVTGAAVEFTGALAGLNALDFLTVDIQIQNGEGITTAPTIASAFLGTGERPYSMLDSPKPVVPNQSLTVTVQNLHTTINLDLVHIVFWVDEFLTFRDGAEAAFAQAAQPALPQIAMPAPMAAPIPAMPMAAPIPMAAPMPAAWQNQELQQAMQQQQVAQLLMANAARQQQWNQAIQVAGANPVFLPGYQP